MKAIFAIITASAIAVAVVVAVATPATQAGGCTVVKMKSGQTLVVHDGAAKQFFATNK